MGLKNGLLISHVILIENGRFYFDLVPKASEYNGKPSRGGTGNPTLFQRP